MAFTLDPEVGAALAAMAGAGPVPVIERGDTYALRELTNTTMRYLSTLDPATPDVEISDYEIATGDGAAVLGRWYARRGSAPGSAVVYLHGGGMMCGSVSIYDTIVSGYVQATGVPFLSIDYRLAPERPGTIPVEDSVAGLVWLHEHAHELGVDPGRIAIMGDSSGGGVAAGVAIAARDRGIGLAKQILIYPMLDDRNLEPDPEIASYATWTYDNNYTGWYALLGDALAGPDVPALAAPARIENVAGLASAYIEVGELDIFRDEDLTYAARLYQAGVSVEVHVHPEVPHSFERIAPGSDVARRSIADRQRVIRRL